MGEVRNRWRGVVVGCSRWKNKKMRGTKKEEEKRGQKNNL